MDGKAPLRGAARERRWKAHDSTASGMTRVYSKTRRMHLAGRSVNSRRLSIESLSVKAR
jgi:hypothetical protein